MPELITVFVCDQSEIVRKGIELLTTRSGIASVVGSCGNGNEALDRIRELKPQVVVMDINLSGLNGIELARLLKLETEPPRILVLSETSDEQTVVMALGSGADAYCLKDSNPQTFEDALLSASLGACWLHPSIGARLWRYCLQESGNGRRNVPHPGSKDAQARLSARELQVLQLIAAGLSNRQIGEQLFLSMETVKTHIRHIMEKLQVADRTQAAIKAMREGILESA